MKYFFNIVHCIIYLCIGLTLALYSPTTSANDSKKKPSFSISGTLKVTQISDGDSIRSDKLRIRLFGIDAPEKKQQCTDAKGKKWDCGIAAQKALEQLIDSASKLSCELKDVDRYGRLVMRCYAGKIDIGAALVKAGLALTYKQYSLIYTQDENAAKTAQAGMWGGSFIEPWTWRNTQKKNVLANQ